MALHEYEILEKMASGTFGIVFKVRRITDHKVFVMKRIPLLDLNADQRRDAAQEVAVMRDLRHPCVVEQMDAFLFNSYDLCLILEYYDGGDMDTRTAAQRERDVYFDFEQVMLWFVQLVLGVQYLHANNVVHRDIKTHNVFVRKRDSSVSLGDFGISERISAEAANDTWCATTVGGRHDDSFHYTPGGGAGEGLYAGATPLHDEGLHHLQPTPSFSVHFTEEDGVPPPHTPDALRLRSPPPLHQSAPASQPQLRRHVSNAGTTASFFGSPRSPWGGGRMEAAMKGTPLYMAPEVLQGGAASPKSDVWSLGCVLYELLALRHPFESRDLATLVMRVSRGQREPLPPHYPRPIQDVINRMLHLDAAQRPTCEEVLTTPCVAAYVERWRSLRTPLDIPASPSESALAAQLTAWQANVLSMAAKHPHDPRCAIVHFTDVARQLMPPACSPSDEREATERRATEAARAALLTAGPSTSFCSAPSFSGTSANPNNINSNAGGVTEGTFFYGATGRRITAGVDGYGSGEEVSDAAAACVALTESMRPHMVYDATSLWGQGPAKTLDTPTSAVHCDESPVKSTSAPAKQRQQHRKKRSGHSTNASSDNSHTSTSFPSLSTPASSPRVGQHRHHRESRQRGAATKGNQSSSHRESGSPDPSAVPDVSEGGPLPSTSPPPPLRGAVASPLKKPLRTTGVVPLPAIPPPTRLPLEEEVLFFKAFPNVVDMRYASVEDVAEAVVQMRQRVQQRMRHQRVLLDIEQLHTRHGSAPLQSMPNVLNVLATAAAASSQQEEAEAAAAVGALIPKGRSSKGGTGRGGASAEHSSSSSAVPPEDVYAHMERQISEERGGRQRQEAIDKAWAAAQEGGETVEVERTDEVGAVGNGGHHNLRQCMSRPPPAYVRQLREVAALAEAEAARERLQRQDVSPHSSPAVPFADPTMPLQLSTTTHHANGGDEAAQEQQRWAAYVQRRNRLSATLTRMLDRVSLRAVYAYYLACPVLQRDAQLVRRLVPARSQWTALPLVEELVVLDRRLQPLLDKAA
jgi:serine/threonine protein kinase